MKTRKTSRLAIRLPEKEMEQIQMNARSANRTVSAFVREIALNFCVLNCDYDSISKHAHEITSLRNAINQLVYTIKKTGEYVPADLEYILNKMNEISKSEKEFLGLMIGEKEKKTKAISREARKIVREKISK